MEFGINESFMKANLKSSPQAAMKFHTPYSIPQTFIKITSRENASVKLARRLARDSAARRETGLFLAEGQKLIEEALRSGLVPVEAFFTEKNINKRPELVERLRGSEINIISEEISNKISDTKTPQGEFCIFKIPDMPPYEGKIISNGRYIILCGLQDPGNAGNIVRTGEAFGIDGIFFNDCPDIYSPKLLRAAAGSVFRQPVFHARDIFGLTEHLKSCKVAVYAAALTGTDINITDINHKSGAAIIIGNEGNGLPRDVIELADYSVTIPMPGKSESLNAATAAAIFCWELRKSGSF